MEAIKAAIGLNNGWAFGGGFAGLLLIGVVGFLIYSNSGDEIVAANIQGPRAITISEPAPTTVAADPVDPARSDVASDATDSKPVRTALPSRARKSMATPVKAKPIAVRATTTVVARHATPNQNIQNSPTLGYYAEDRDESLRLTDIFDDLGTRELD